MWKEHQGIEVKVPFIKLLRYLKLRAKGALDYKDLGEKICMAEGNNMNIMYMGYAIKKTIIFAVGYRYFRNRREK